MPVVDKIMRKYKHVHLEVIGSIDKQALNIFNDFDPKCLDRCDILSGTWTFNEYPKYLASRGLISDLHHLLTLHSHDQSLILNGWNILCTKFQPLPLRYIHTICHSGKEKLLNTIRLVCL